MAMAITDGYHKYTKTHSITKIVNAENNGNEEEN